MDAEVGVFEDQAACGRDTEAVGGQEEGFGVGLAVFVVFGADQSVEAVEYLERVERCGDGFAGATGNYGEWDFAMPGVDVFEDFGDGFQLWKEFVVQLFFARADGFDGHAQAVLFVEHGDDFGDGGATEKVEMMFVEVAVPFGEDFFPGDVVQGHGIGDGAVAIEEIGVVGAGRELKFHLRRSSFFIDEALFCGRQRRRRRKRVSHCGTERMKEMWD